MREGDIATANNAAATDVVSSTSIEENASDFNDLTDAQQASRIETARVDLQAAITSAQETVDTEAQDLETGVPSLVSTARTKGEELTEALDAQDAATTSADNAATAAGSVSDASEDVTYTYSAGLITATDTTDNDAIALTEVNSGSVSLVEGVTLNEDTGNYEFSTGGTSSIDVAIEKDYLDALVTRVQAEYDASDDVDSAQTALASAINDVYNAQDTDGYDDDNDSNTDNVDYDISYAELAENSATIVDVAVDNSVTLDLDGSTDTLTNADTAINALTDLDEYESALTQLASDEKALVDFNDAVAEWEEVDALAAELQELNDTLGTDGDPADEGTLHGDVTAAQEAIENDEDADPAGLGISLLEGADNFTTEDDVYLFAESEGDQTGPGLSGFGDSGEDQIYFGEGFSLVALGDSDISDNVGDINAQEIFWEQEGSNVNLYVEAETFGGNSAGDADVTQVTLTGVDGADINDNLGNGFLTAGTEVA